MHKSQLAGFIIDCQTDDLDAAAEFWSQALGYARNRDKGPDEENYELLDTGDDNLHIELQSVEHESRVHLDIESDDINAEVERLEKLGAKRIRKVRSWWVMEAPTGHRFCIVQPQRSGFSDTARQWDS